MADHLQPSASHGVAVHLLDSALGHPLQTWQFQDQQSITIGRDDGNDIAVSDPHVSRIHAKLVNLEGDWKLISTGRHGTFVNDHLVSEIPLTHLTVFRLGSSGPMLRFDTQKFEGRRSETIANIDTDMFSMLEVDELRKQQEVDQIAGDVLFQELKEQSRRFKAGDKKQ